MVGWAQQLSGTKWSYSEQGGPNRASQVRDDRPWAWRNLCSQLWASWPTYRWGSHSSDSIDQIVITTAVLLAPLSKAGPGPWVLSARRLGQVQGRWPLKASAFLTRAGPTHMTSVLGPRAALVSWIASFSSRDHSRRGSQPRALDSADSSLCSDLVQLRASCVPDSKRSQQHFFVFHEVFGPWAELRHFLL